jgi:hypothetical protein
MRRTWPVTFSVLMLSLALVSCINEAAYAPKPAKVLDRVLFNRAADALDQGKFDVARITFQTLINTYPDSGYAAMAQWILESDPRLDCHMQTDFRDSLCNEGEEISN